MLKGAGALLVRLPEARHSRDIDLAFAVDPARDVVGGPGPERAVEGAARSLMAAAARDLGDHFRFEVPRTSRLAEAAKGRRLADHVADKVCAIVEVHDGPGGPLVSTRVKDLVDLALIAATQSVPADDAILAVRAGAIHRGLRLPPRFTVPDLEVWRRGYPAKAREAPGAVLEFTEAVRLVASFLDPILDGMACGTWTPTEARWR